MLILTGATSDTAQKRALPADAASPYSLGSSSGGIYTLIDTNVNSGSEAPDGSAAPSDPGAPSASADLPKTGDSANLALCAALLAASALCAAPLTRKLKKQH